MFPLWESARDFPFEDDFELGDDAPELLSDDEEDDEASAKPPASASKRLP